MSCKLISLCIALSLVLVTILVYSFRDNHKEDLSTPPPASLEQKLTPENLKASKKLRRLTQTGYKAKTLEKGLRLNLDEYWRKNKGAGKREIPPKRFIYSALDSSDTNFLKLVTLPEKLKKDLEEYVKGQLSQWTRVPLEDLKIESTYGMRIYSRGSVLRVHTDTFSTHVLSAIVHIGRTGSPGKGDWPLQVWPDGNDSLESILMKPYGTDLVLYESASLPHAREHPCPWDTYGNAFIHFSVPGWKEESFNIMNYG